VWEAGTWEKETKQKGANINTPDTDPDPKQKITKSIQKLEDTDLADTTTQNQAKPKHACVTKNGP
jgi:hypothetical protein